MQQQRQRENVAAVGDGPLFAAANPARARTVRRLYSSTLVSDGRLNQPRVCTVFRFQST